MEFDPAAFDDLGWWAEQDRAQAIRIIRLVRDIQRDPFSGIGKPGPLRHELAGCWSRRIDSEHRLVYQVRPDKIRILAGAITTVSDHRKTRFFERRADRYRRAGAGNGSIQRLCRPQIVHWRVVGGWGGAGGVIAAAR
jgi:toxin YoeB